ncbi:MAG: ATP-dependent helicase [Thermoguttaceae bacterium]
MSLNKAQREAVETLSGPLLVLAGAGTGKTRVVTHRIARLIASGIAPERILGVTFTTKAAREMLDRVKPLIASKLKSAKSRPEISTFHALCVKILRRHCERIGYPSQFAIYTRGDQESLARQALAEVRVTSAALQPSELISIISSWKSQGLTPATAGSSVWSAKHHLALLAYKQYQTMLKTRGAVDFDDMLMLTDQLFREHQDVLDREAGRFDHLLIDEYQDTNSLQYRIVKGLATPHRNLCVVGDDDQSIYAWRGAEVTHILHFKNDWPDAKVVRLEANYRSTAEILAWANSIISHNTSRHDKKLRSEVFGEKPRILSCANGEMEAQTVVDQIKERLKSSHREPHDFAILFRTNTQPRLFELALRAAQIPYSLVGGQSFFDRKEICDLLAYLRVIARPHDDVSLLRILNTPPRGIGSASAQKILDAALAAKSSVWTILGEPQSLGLSEKTLSAIGAFRQVVTQFRHQLCETFRPETIATFIDKIDYRQEISRQYHAAEEQASRWESVGELVTAAAQYARDDDEPTLTGFLDGTSLGGSDFARDDTKERSQNAVALMTLHSAKGLEFPEVYLVGMEEGLLPHHRSVAENDEAAIAEERRLCYVGITRAEKRLTLTLAKEREKWGKMRPTVPSRFLYEITDQTTNPNYARAAAGQVPK